MNKRGGHLPEPLEKESIKAECKGMRASSSLAAGERNRSQGKTEIESCQAKLCSRLDKLEHDTTGISDFSAPG